MVVLLVDDSEADRVLYRAVLESHGYHVIQADGAASLADACKSAFPDLILLDGLLPGIDGFELCRKLRDQPDFQAIPILIQSAMDEHEAMALARDAGAAAFVSKGGDWAGLLAAIKSATSPS